MPLTLAEAKVQLSTYVDNGVCSSDSRVVLKINEAQRRLYERRSWLGVFARFYLPVDNNTFTLPSYTGNISTVAGFGLQSASFVHKSDLTSGTVVNDVRAFVTPTSELLDITPSNTDGDIRSFKIHGDPVTAIEITGKLNIIDAKEDTDLLLIDDLEALKLILLAIFREENDQLESAQALEAKAVERLTLKTDMAVEAARRLNYQTRLTSETEGSFGQFLSRIALEIEGGRRMFDGELADLINQAEENLFTLGRWYGTTQHLKVAIDNAGEIYLPTTVGALLGVTADGRPLRVQDQMFDYHENGPGYQAKGTAGYEMLIERGERLIQNSWMRCYFVRAAVNLGTCVEILAKKRWQRKRKNSDKMDIRNFPAIREMVLSLRTAPTPEVSQAHENKAIYLLQKELKEMRGSARSTIQVQAPAFAAGEITALI
jgi:predicted secreted protein